MNEISSLMKDLKIFNRLPDHTLEEISSFAKLSVYEAGQVIHAQGLSPQGFYIIYEGKAEVVLDNGSGEKVSLAVLGSGEYFGEMSLVTGELTSASIVAVKTCKILIISKEGFIKLLTFIPELSVDLVKTLSLRLKRVNQTVWEEKNKGIFLTQLMDQGEKSHNSEIVGKSKYIKKIKESLPQWSSLGTPLCIIGEHGTGKELIARAIHLSGRRKDKPFFSLDCGSLDSEKLGEKLFGKFGLLALADQGTLLLRNANLLGAVNLRQLFEFSELPLFNVSIIFSSRIDLIQRYEQEDLNAGILKKMFGHVIKSVPLRQRKKDIPDLIQYYLESYVKKFNKPFPVVSKDAMEKLLSYDYYQGNISELIEALERAILFAEGNIISPEHVFLGKVPPRPPALNILHFKPLLGIIQRGIFPGLIQYVMAAAFIVIIAECFFGAKELDGNWATQFTWSIGWPVLILLAVVFGKVFCSACPMSFIASCFQRVLHFDKPVPTFFKQYSFAIITFLFIFIFWVEEVTNMRCSPEATGILLLSITALATLTAIFFPRDTWCRYLCPFGGMFGICSMAAIFELRSNTELCFNKCTTHDCYKGTSKVGGCPLFQQVPFIDSNQSCKLCLHCVRNCPNGSVQLNIRPPAWEIWNLHHVNRKMVLFVVAFLIIIFPLTIFGGLRATLIPYEWFKWFTVFYWLFVVTTISMTLSLVANRFNDDEFLPQIRSLFAFVPLTVGAHIAYQLKFLPGISSIIINILYIFPNTQGKELLNITGSKLLAAASVITGLIFSLLCAQKISKNSTDTRFFLIKNAAAIVTCFIFLMYTFLVIS